MYNRTNFNFFANNDDEDHGMRRNALWSIVTGLLLFVGIPAVGKADFQYSIVNPTGGPTGGTFVLAASASTPVQIFLNQNGAGTQPQPIGSLQIRVTIGGGAGGVPQIVTTAGGVTPAGSFVPPLFTGTPIFNAPFSSQMVYDLSSATGTTMAPNTNQLVATVNLNTLGFAGQGPFNFSLSSVGSSAVLSPTAATYTNTVLSGGTFTVAAVPEPSSIALLGMVGVGVVAARRFRKKSKA